MILLPTVIYVNTVKKAAKLVVATDAFARGPAVWFFALLGHTKEEQIT